MSNSNGVDHLHLRQFRAMAENLCSLANWHREHHNYVVADALYTRSLSITERISIAGMMGTISVPEFGQSSKLPKTCCVPQRSMASDRERDQRV